MHHPKGGPPLDFIKQKGISSTKKGSASRDNFYGSSGTTKKEKIRAYCSNIYNVKRSIATAKTIGSPQSFPSLYFLQSMVFYCIVFPKVKEGKLVIFRFPNVSKYILDNTNWFSSSVHIWLI